MINHIAAQVSDYSHRSDSKRPSLRTTLVSLLASIAPVATTSRRLQADYQPMIVQGFQLNNSTCFRSTELGRRDGFKIQDSDCGFVASSIPPNTNTTDWVQISLKDGDSLQCNPVDKSVRNNQAIESSLQCVKDARDKWRYELDREWALVPLSVWWGPGLLQNLCEAMCAGGIVSQANESPAHIYTAATLSVFAGTALGLGEQGLGYLGGLLFNLRYPDTFTQDNLGRCATGTALFAGAALACVTIRSLLPSPTDQQLPRLANMMGVLVAATVALQRTTSHFVGSEMLDGNTENARHDYFIVSLGAALLSPIAIALMCQAQRQDSPAENNPREVQLADLENQPQPTPQAQAEPAQNQD